VTAEQDALYLLHLGLIDIRAIAWDNSTSGMDQEQRLARIAMIADALHNLPTAIGVGKASDVLQQVSAEPSPRGKWLAEARRLNPRHTAGG
jgi:hypothetical protein